MRIVITGNQGFIGRTLTQALEPMAEIIGLNRQTGNLADTDFVVTQVANWEADIIIHAAAMADVRACEQARELAYESHVVLSENIAKAAQQIGAKLIFLSSDQVYDKWEASIKTELTQPRPQTYYGELKMMAEKVIQRECPTAIIFRLGWQYQKTGELHGIYALVARAIAMETPLRFHPQARQYPCDIRLTVAVIQAACRGEIPRGIYNLTQQTQLTIGELFTEIYRELNGDPERERLLLQADVHWEATQLQAKPAALQVIDFRDWPLIYTK